MANPLKIIKNGIIDENPTFVQVIGMCPTLAVTSSAINGLGMGVSTAAVLICANVVISLIRNFIPDKVRIPAFVVVIASFVTIVDFILQAYAPSSLYNALGLYIPLIVVNCIILGRAEAFASKNGAVASFFDGVGQGLGFTIALCWCCYSFRHPDSSYNIPTDTYTYNGSRCVLRSWYAYGTFQLLQK